MASPPSRTSQYNKVYTVLKKHYEMVASDPTRSVFEHLLFASCLENAHYDRAEEAFAALVHNFFDWNEIRVSTVRELSEVLSGLPEPPVAANRLKRVLQSIFESTYSFDLEQLRKQNLTPAVDHLKKLDGTTNFSVAYVVQSALGGHSIPVDAGVLSALCVVGLVTEEHIKAQVAPGLERAIVKSKGLEFGSQLHQFGADFIANPYSPVLHGILLEIDPDAGERLPKRRARKRAESAAGHAEQTAAQTEAERKSEKKPPAEAKEEAAEHNRKRAADKKKSATTKRKSTGKDTTETAGIEPQDDNVTQKPASTGLSKRKPR